MPGSLLKHTGNSKAGLRHALGGMRVAGRVMATPLALSLGVLVVSLTGREASNPGIGGVMITASLLALALSGPIAMVIILGGGFVCRRAVLVSGFVALTTGTIGAFAWSSTRQYSIWGLIFGASMALAGATTIITIRKGTAWIRASALLLGTVALGSSMGVTLIAPALLALASILFTIAIVGFK